MGWKTVKKKRPKWIVPPEAPGIASSFRSAAGKLRGVSGNLRSVGGELDGSWEGNSKNLFMADFSPEPGNVDSFASWLDGAASRIESMTVMIWETYTEREWEPDPPEGGE
jgi:uncharacterized protein YukE